MNTFTPHAMPLPDGRFIAYYRLRGHAGAASVVQSIMVSLARCWTARDARHYARRHCLKLGFVPRPGWPAR
jgi:hypothetical protein